MKRRSLLALPLAGLVQAAAGRRPAFQAVRGDWAEVGRGSSIRGLENDKYCERVRVLVDGLEVTTRARSARHAVSVDVYYPALVDGEYRYIVDPTDANSVLTFRFHASSVQIYGSDQKIKHSDADKKVHSENVRALIRAHPDGERWIERLDLFAGGSPRFTLPPPDFLGARARFNNQSKNIHWV